MSAKSDRKSIPLTLDAATYGALARYAKARRARSLAAAARLALREAVDAPPTREPSASARPRRLRVQLEPALRAALAAEARHGDDESATLARVLRLRLGRNNREA